MAIPSGYTALDFVGFTDKGTYNSSATYVRNDLVHYGGNIMKCLIDNTIGVTPIEGANWTLWVGASANLVERIVAPLENNPADIAYGVGRQIIYDDWMWEVVKPIAIGDSLIDVNVDPTNGNIKKADPVETQLLAVKAEADATDAMIAPLETSPATAAHTVGTQLIYNNVLYTVTAAIAANDPLATSGAGANITPSADLAAQIAAKANSADLGTAAAKDSTNAVTNGSTDLVESGAVYTQTSALATSIATSEANIAPVESGANVSQNYAIGEKFIRGDVLYKAKVALTSGTAWSSLTLNTDYEAAGTVTSEIEALTNNKADKTDVINWDDMSVLGAVNLLPTPYADSDGTGPGYTYQFRDDGSVSISGTSTSLSTTGINIKLMDNFIQNYIGKRLKFSIEGLPGVANEIAYVPTILYDSNNVQISRVDLDASNPSVTFTVPNNAAYFTAQIYIHAGATINTTLYPMLTLAEYNGDYVPYVMTNRELVEKRDYLIPAVTKFTIDTSSNGNHIICRKGNAISLNLVMTSNENVAVWETLLTLPKGFRFRPLLYCIGFDYNNKQNLYYFGISGSTLYTYQAIPSGTKIFISVTGVAND